MNGNPTTQLQNNGAFDSKSIIRQSENIPRFDLNFVGKSILHFEFTAKKSVMEN